MLERTYITDAVKQLGYKDKRTFRRWCANNDVGLLQDTGSLKLYVIKSEFEEALLRKSIQYLKEKSKRITVSEKRKRSELSAYAPLGDNEKKFLARLTNKITEQ